MTWRDRRLGASKVMMCPLDGATGTHGRSSRAQGPVASTDMVRAERAAHRANRRVGTARKRHDLGPFVDVHARRQDGAMHDWRPSMRVDLPVGIDGAAGDIGRQQRLATADLLRFEELDVELSLPLRGDARQQPLALLLRPGDAHGRPLEVAHGSAAERFEDFGKLREGVASPPTAGVTAACRGRRRIARR